MKLLHKRATDYFEISSLVLLCLLLSADIVFMILHCLYYMTDWITFDYFKVTRDRGYGEMYQYIKEFWMILLFGALFVRRRQWIYIIFAMLFIYLLIDDSFGVHEYVGELIGLRFEFQPALGLRPVDFGELIVSAFFGGLFLPLLAVGYITTKPCDKHVVRGIFVLILLLAFFGVFVDVVHVIFKGASVGWLWGLLEDGGEMIAMSMMVGYAFSFLIKEKEETACLN